VTSVADESLYRVSRSDGRVTSSGAYATGRGLARQDGARLWVVSPTDGVVRLADVGSLQYSPGDSIPLPVAQVPGFGPIYSAVTVGGGSVWVVEDGDHEVSRWRHRVLAPARLVHRYPLHYGDFALGAAFGDGAAWFGLGHWADAVLRIDAATGKARRIQVGTWPTKPAYGFDSVWVPMFRDDTVWRLDPGTGKPQAIVHVGHRPWAVAVGRNAVWVTDHCDGTVKQIDPASNAVVQTIHTGYHPQWLTAAQGSIWVGVTGKEDPGPMSCGSQSTA
jgi:DNA-binding beta-propeller fold protein YncE